MEYAVHLGGGFAGAVIAKSNHGPLLWSIQGYHDLPPQTHIPRIVDCLTPEAILSTLSNGYEPQWHVSANQDGPSDAQI